MANQYIAYRPFEKQAIELLNQYMPVPIALLSLLLAYYGEHSILLVLISVIFILYNLSIKKLKELLPDHSQPFELIRNTANGIICALFAYFVGKNYPGYLFCIPLLFAIPFTFKLIPTIIMIAYTLFCSVLGYLIATEFVLSGSDMAFIVGLMIFSYLGIIGVKVLRNHFIEMDILTEDLKNEIVKRKKTEKTLQHAKINLEKAWNQLNATQKELIDSAHKAGMADIATGTLHNIGNILNSVIASAQLVEEFNKSRSVARLKRANKLLKENINNIENFILEHPKGKKLLEYYLELDPLFDEEKKETTLHINRMLNKLDAIKDVLADQQNYAGTASLTDHCDLVDIMEDALLVQKDGFAEFRLTTVKEFIDTPKITIQKTKLIHILVNLIKNAKEAMMEAPSENRTLTLSVFPQNKNAYIKVKDTGAGIASENINKIFVHGYTTKKSGHGFGLHSCANYMTEMGGKIWVESEGQGKGSTFVLEFPL